MNKLKCFEIRSMMRRAANSDGFELDVVGIEVGINRRENEGDNSYASRVLAELKDMYRALHAADSAPAIIMEESLPAPAAQHYEEIKDRLDKLGEKVDQASASLKEIIQEQFRPAATGVNLDELITSRGVSESAIELGKHTHNLLHKRFPGTIGSVCDELKGMSQLDYFREQFMTAPIKSSCPGKEEIRAKCFNEHFDFDPSNFQDVMRVTSECLQARRAGEQMANAVLRSKRVEAAQAYVHGLFNDVSSGALKDQVNRDFGEGSATASNDEYILILNSIYNLLMKRAQDKALAGE